MQSLIALTVVIVFIFIYSISMSKNYGYNFVSFMRIFVRRLATFIISFSWIIVLATLFMLAFYSNLNSLLKDILTVDSINNLKILIRLFFGVDSAFVALQTLALYSIMFSFVSCLALLVGLAINFLYRTILKVTRLNLVDKSRCADYSSQHTMPTFKLFLKYNS